MHLPPPSGSRLPWLASSQVLVVLGSNNFFSLLLPARLASYYTGDLLPREVDLHLCRPRVRLIGSWPPPLYSENLHFRPIFFWALISPSPLVLMMRLVSNSGFFSWESCFVSPQPITVWYGWRDLPSLHLFSRPSLCWYIPFGFAGRGFYLTSSSEIASSEAIFMVLFVVTPVPNTKQSNFLCFPTQLSFVFKFNEMLISNQPIQP